MENKKAIITRLYVVFIFFLLVGVLVLFQSFNIQFIQGEHWREKAETQTLVYRNIEAVRGNIFAADGSLLATSIPNYEVRFDPNTEYLTDELFYAGIDSLAYSLSKLFQDKSEKEYKHQLVNARKRGERYHLIKRKATFNELKRLREFPIFRLGRYKGGMIYVQRNMRQKPFKMLAARTIGYEVETNKVGLEGAYSEYLSGTGGKRLMQKIAGGVWMPVNDDNEIEPEDGADLITTIDVNIQDVAHNALLEQLTKQNADHGTVILMEVKTGHIKAIANLSRNLDGTYSEKYNYAIGESTEPGSTFKLASLMAAFEDNYVKPTDSVDTYDGTYQFYDRVMRDSKEGGYGKLTVAEAFALSSNVAISKIINDNYAANPQKFIERMKRMHLHEPLNLEITGEGKPLIKNPTDKSWSGITLPWMSIGYELRLTPLQILTFYNAVANDGKMVKPMFVKEIRHRGKLVKSNKTEVIDESICSSSTIKKAQAILELVVEKGTAANLRNSNFKIAAKTGTAQIANDKYGYRYNSKVSYQASLAGYFPADNPKYSCIVVVNAPSHNVYYGNLVAGPIFKEIADKVYATQMEIHKERFDNTLAKTYPYSQGGDVNDLITVFEKFKVPVSNTNNNTNWVKTFTQEDGVKMKDNTINSDYMPNVLGMSVKDAIYILENKGMEVRIQGSGMVKKQSVAPGTPLNNSARNIILELS